MFCVEVFQVTGAIANCVVLLLVKAATEKVYKTGCKLLDLELLLGLHGGKYHAGVLCSGVFRVPEYSS